MYTNYIKKSVGLLFGAALLLIASCKPDDNNPTPVTEYGTMEVKFNYVFGSNEEPFMLGEEYVHPKTNDKLTFSMLKFYVSNIKLQREDGSWWVQPESYYLVCNDCSEENHSITVNDIPTGKYKAIEYTFGVDSARNVSGANDGALAFDHAMFWSWNTGYIMMKVEGNSPNSPNTNGIFQLHFGGFKGEYNIVTTKHADFSSQMNINKSTKRIVTLTANPAKLWHTAEGVSKVYILHNEGPEAKQMATDFYDGVYLKSVE